MSVQTNVLIAEGEPVMLCGLKYALAHEDHNILQALALLLQRSPSAAVLQQSKESLKASAGQALAVVATASLT